MKTLLALFLLIPSLSWGETSPLIDDKKVICLADTSDSIATVGLNFFTGGIPENAIEKNENYSLGLVKFIYFNDSLIEPVIKELAYKSEFKRILIYDLDLSKNTAMTINRDNGRLSFSGVYDSFLLEMKEEFGIFNCSYKKTDDLVGDVKAITFIGALSLKEKRKI